MIGALLFQPPGRASSCHVAGGGRKNKVVPAQNWERSSHTLKVTSNHGSSRIHGEPCRRTGNWNRLLLLSVTLVVQPELLTTPLKCAGRATAWPCLRSGPFLVGISPICFKSPLMYFLHSILLGFICLGSGLKGHVVSLGLLSINACLFSAEVQAVLFIYLFGGFKVIKREALPAGGCLGLCSACCP